MNIYGTYDENESLILFESFLEKGSNLGPRFIKSMGSIQEHYLRHMQLTKDPFISRASNQAETFHTVLIIKQIKNLTKVFNGFMECMGVVMQYYELKTRNKSIPKYFT